MSTSLWQMPHASTFTRTCPGPGCGMSRSTNSQFPPGLPICAAFIVFIIRLLGLLLLFSGLDELQELFVEMLLTCVSEAVRTARVDFQRGVSHELDREPTSLSERRIKRNGIRSVTFNCSQPWSSSAHSSVSMQYSLSNDNIAAADNKGRSGLSETNVTSKLS